jgi:hypothetical protein
MLDSAHPVIAHDAIDKAAMRRVRCMAAPSLFAETVHTDFLLRRRRFGWRRGALLESRPAKMGGMSGRRRTGLHVNGLAGHGEG